MALKVSIEQPTTLFQKHLHQEGNDRLIFSGAFGTGKTYFLNEFFSLENKKYISVKLAPVNYSLSSNEDIFKLIKYDILFELLAKHKVTLEGETINWDVALGTLVPAKIESIVKSFLGIIPLLNKSTDTIQKALDSIKELSTIIEEIKKQRKEAAKESEVINFGEDIIKMFHLETDYITQFLEENLNKLSAENKNAIKVLIIDDLDRIDPEHIFRLFNVFSAHLDYNGSTNNKFGFDKVIFVCDIHNIRNIFHSRYGADTDFTGYIDKFFSQEVYHFSNEAAIKNFTEKFIKSIVIGESHEHYFQLNIVQGRNYRELSMLAIILNELIMCNALKMRRLKASYGMSFEFSQESIHLHDTYSREVHVWKMPAVIIIKTVSRILGGGESLSRAIKTAIRFRRSNEYKTTHVNNNDWLLGNLLPIVDYENHKFKSANYNNNTEYVYMTSQSLNPISYTLVETGDRHDYYYAKVGDGLEKADFFEVLLSTVDILLREGLLK